MKFGIPVFFLLHVALFIIFILLSVPPLIVFNGCSVIMYLFAWILVRKGYTHFPALLAYLEIAGSILLSVICLGWDSGFYLWIFVQGVTVFIAYRWKYWLKWSMVAISFLILAILLFFMKDRPPLYPLGHLHNRLLFLYNNFGLLLSFVMAFFYFNWSAEHTEKALSAEHRKSQSLLLNILPVATAKRLSDGEEMIADGFDSCSILFADIVGFTALSSRMDAESLVQLLNRIFCEFDDLAEKWNLEKIKTIGDAYMAAAGVPEPRENPTALLVCYALDMLKVLEKVNAEGKTSLQLRIGIHTGKAVAGVIGKKKFTYDIWGDTVNIASRMESHGVPGRIQLSKAARDCIADQFEMESRGVLQIKGKGEMEVFLLLTKKGQSK